MRYAIFYAPRETDELHDVASRWLGHDALRGTNREQPSPIPGVNLGELTREPRRYGFHATLKPPFAMASSGSPEALVSAVNGVASQIAPITIPALRIARIDRFFALKATGDQRELNDLAARCVADLDSYRAPPSLAELMRRRSLGLTGRQELLLHRWGYPFVMEEYRFHLTLTGPCDDAVAPVLEAALVEQFTPVLGMSLVMDSLSIFIEPAAGEPFVFLTRVPLTGESSWAAPRVLAAS